MSDLTVLLARVEAASGPDRSLEVSLWRSLDDGVAGREPLPWLKCYTESIDAALALVMRVIPYSAYQLTNDYGGFNRAHLNVAPGCEGWPVGGWNAEATAETMPLAILAALLRA